MIETILFVFFMVMSVLYASWIVLLLLPRKETETTYTPSMSVIIPAHNEGGNIESTIRSVLEAEYPNEREIIVVNDGSTDNTDNIVRKTSEIDERVRLYTVEHGGKANAINQGVKKSKNELVVVLDADSRLGEGALTEISRLFSDKGVGAVSGIIRAAENNNPLTWFQDFEYALSSAWRYICNKVGGTYILPGFAAFRRDALLKIGGFSRDTLSEDFEIGLRLKKAGYSLLMSKAVMYTKVPQTIKALGRQRIRWGCGTVQVMKKHFDIPFNVKYGAVGVYGIPTQIYWFIHGLICIPITLYQIFEGYLRYFIAYDNFISMDVARYFFGWFSAYGMVEYTYRTITGEYIMSILFFLIVGSFCLNMIYIIAAIMKMAEFRLRYLFVVFFFFPYSLFILSLYVFPALQELCSKRENVNIWEKTIDG
ncbi:MAG: glycosyltransferase family 2 protein [Candidatus Altiarchaeota archaeon]|nr:glycosyltransferase family 2 protein [Candidatus Altiarchaeota archaeon]